MFLLTLSDSGSGENIVDSFVVVKNNVLSSNLMAQSNQRNDGLATKQDLVLPKLYDPK